MITSRSVRLASLALCLCACAAVASAQEVTFSAMPNQDFSKFKTYRWVDLKSNAAPDHITEQGIRAAVDTELAKKGLTKTESQNADLYVGYQVAIDHQTESTSYTTGATGWGTSMHGGATTSTSTTISVGMLEIDVYDRTAKELIWRGAAAKALDPSSTPEGRLANVGTAVKKVLANYPPPAETK